MTSPTVRKILAHFAAATIAVGGITLIDRLPSPASADTRVTDAAHSPGAVQEAREAPSRMDGVSHQSAAVTDEQHQEVLEYWTEERMAAAEPIAMVVAGLLDDNLPLPGTGPPGDAEPQAVPSPDSDGTPWDRGGAVTQTTGKVFLTMDGRDFTCSAAVVDSQNQSTLVTAGHCAKDGTGAWARNWTFVPGYDDGDGPHGRYTARDLLVSPHWSNEADDSYDFAMAVLNEEDGTPVQERVGSQEIAFDTWSEERAREGVQVYTFGYPAADPFDGRELHYCSGRTVPDTGGTTANGVRCTMTQGSSGGPWFTDFDAENGRGTVSSVVSFKYADDQSTQFGPRLGAEAQRLHEYAENL